MLMLGFRGGLKHRVGGLWGPRKMTLPRLPPQSDPRRGNESHGWPVPGVSIFRGALMMMVWQLVEGMLPLHLPQAPHPAIKATKPTKFFRPR
jgi:hypothetical protein